jgi:hypothetical protein
VKSHLLAAALVAVGGCVSGRDCALAIPQEMRADTIRYALDRGMVKRDLIPREDLWLALGAGTAAAALTDARRVEIAPHVAAYTSCVKERIDRSP